LRRRPGPPREQQDLAAQGQGVTTPYGDVPPTQNQLPQWPSYPPLPPTWDKSQNRSWNGLAINRSWNGLAIASFVLGILPGSLIAVGLGIGALVQIGRGGGKGRWMAIVALYWGHCGRGPWPPGSPPNA